MMRKHFKNLVHLYVLIGFSVSIAGPAEDYFSAILRDDTSAVYTLMLRGFDPNTLNPDKQHGLFLALRAESVKVAKVLIQTPQVDVNMLNQNGESPLMMAVFRGNTELVNALLARDADVNKTGWTPLHYAATAGNLPLIALLLDKHAYIDAESPNGTTPLMMAAQYGNPAAVKLLLEEGADPLIKNQLGLTAIDFAQRAQRPDSAELIGAFVRAKESKGKW
jgi:uncharacterized protein